MGDIFKIGQVIQDDSTHIQCKVEEFLGDGGQGEVYKVKLGDTDYALKWYFPHAATPQQKEILEQLIQTGRPTKKFLWPIHLIEQQGINGFGYIMELRPQNYKSIVDLMKRRIEPSFRAVITASIELTNSFLALHTRGMCYRDISFGNMFFEPITGDVLICDNDNVAVDQQSANIGVLGTPRFMAPEVVLGKAKPSTQTDLYSLSVLLFYMFIMHHPLEGEKEAAIKCLDLPAMNKLYGEDPIFIFDPTNHSNRPIPGYHDNAIDFWPIYNQDIRDLFIRSFTKGIEDSENGRVRESEWRSSLVKLRDSIVYCSCGAENFYDIEKIKQQGSLGECWACTKPIILPPRIRINNQIIMLNHDTKLYPHHIDDEKMYDFSYPIAEITQHPSNPSVWGLKNLSNEKWVCKTTDGTIFDVDPSKNVSLVVGTKINFGNSEGEIRI